MEEALADCSGANLSKSKYRELIKMNISTSYRLGRPPVLRNFAIALMIQKHGSESGDAAGSLSTKQTYSSSQELTMIQS
jgi:hypothetical protein